MKTIFTAALLGASLFAGSMSQAAVVSVSDDIIQIATPASVTNAGPVNNVAMQIFNEVQNFVLTSALELRDASGGPNEIIAAGTRINSHMIFLNREATRGRPTELTGTALFDGIILGLITSTRQLDATDDMLGALGTYYEAGFRNRGLEPGDGSFLLSDAGFGLTTTLRVTQPGDWMRVVTLAAVPVPAAGFLLIGAMAGLAALRRRRSPAAS